MSFDNIHIQIRGEKKDDLLAAIKLAMSITNNQAVAYKIDDKYGFIVNWANSESSIQFPVILDAEEVHGIIWKWLNQLDWQKVDSQYDVVSLNGRITSDSDVVQERGWLLYTEEWGNINGRWSAIFAVVPAWLWLGK